MCVYSHTYIYIYRYIFICTLYTQYWILCVYIYPCISCSCFVWLSCIIPILWLDVVAGRNKSSLWSQMLLGWSMAGGRLQLLVDSCWFKRNLRADFPKIFQEVPVFFHIFHVAAMYELLRASFLLDPVLTWFHHKILPSQVFCWHHW